MRRPKRHANRRHVTRMLRQRKEIYMRRFGLLAQFLRDSESETRRLKKVVIEFCDEIRRLKKQLSESKATTEVPR